MKRTIRNRDTGEVLALRVFIAVWVLCFLISLALLGVGIWAVIELVQWIKTK